MFANSRFLATRNREAADSMIFEPPTARGGDDASLCPHAEIERGFLFVALGRASRPILEWPGWQGNSSWFFNDGGVPPPPAVADH